MWYLKGVVDGIVNWLDMSVGVWCKGCTSTGRIISSTTANTTKEAFGQERIKEFVKANYRCLLKSRKLEANLTIRHRSKNPNGTLTNWIQQCLKWIIYKFQIGATPGIKIGLRFENQSV